MQKRRRAVRAAGAIAIAMLLGVVGPGAASAKDKGDGVERAAVQAGKIRNVVVIDLENEDFSETFGPGSPARYLNDILAPQGQLLENYYATSHYSLGNYLTQISGQATTQDQNDDCI